MQEVNYQDFAQGREGPGGVGEGRKGRPKVQYFDRIYPDKEVTGQIKRDDFTCTARIFTGEFSEFLLSRIPSTTRKLPVIIYTYINYDSHSDH